MKIQIESDGTGVTTNVYALGEDGTRTRIRGVQSVTWELDAPGGVAAAVVRLLPVAVNVQGELAGKPHVVLTLPTDLDEAQVDHFLALFRKTVRQAEIDGFKPTITTVEETDNGWLVDGGPAPEGMPETPLIDPDKVDWSKARIEVLGTMAEVGLRLAEVVNQFVPPAHRDAAFAAMRAAIREGTDAP